MSIQHFAFADTLGGQALAAGQAIARILAAPFATLARMARINRTARQLEALDDRTLADIGLRRTHITSTATQVVDWPQADPRRLAR